MSSDGDVVDRYLRVVRVRIDALGVGIDEALEGIPAEHRPAVRARWEEESALPIRRVHILSARGGPRPWFAQWDPSQGYYWRRQRAYLIDRLNWAQSDVESLDDATDKVLSHLEDPRSSGPDEFNVRGLVMGYVQSGKTANFCALIAKAADLGYKLIIVLSGIHNSLRQQTQRRINRALGIDPTGVPLPEPGKRWIPLTNDHLHGDFRPGTINANVLQGNERVLLVVKKNATVLRRLIEWMDNKVPASLPVLIIDDEADQGSINTGGNRPPTDEEADLDPSDVEDPAAAEDELDPSIINGLIRELISCFHRVCYIAYTATPFANVLVNHLAIDREVFEDLYPRDFIVALPRPNGYTGAERLFGREVLPGEAEGVPGLDVIQFIPDHEVGSLTPRNRDLPDYVAHLPQSMRDAILDFILAIAARQHRSGREETATMLIHTHHRKHVQNLLGPVVREHLSELRQLWRYDRESIGPVLRQRWDQEFRPVIASVDLSRDATFKAIEPVIDRLFRDPIPVIVLNSDSQDVLDYEADPTLKAVVVGGNRLSRGLTLEGLLVSYYVRRTEYFDTLMQMGRWFGFRESYVDLTRIWTTDELAEWFRALALAEEELRREIARYEIERLTPLEFGPKIRSHPAMMITAQNKMGSARTISQNYAGRMLQTTAFRLEDRPWLESNLDAAASLISQLPAPNYKPVGNEYPAWKGVSWRQIDEFLSCYRFDARATIEGQAIRQYLQAQAQQGELTEWCVAVCGRQQRTSELGVEPKLTVSGTPIARISRSRLKSSPHSIGTLVNPATKDGEPGSGDEEVGLTAEQIQEAKAAAYAGGELPEELRARRPITEGLLLIYPISPRSKARTSEGNRLPLFENPERDGVTVVGVALVFPSSDSAATIEYVVGSVGEFDAGE